MNAICFCRRTDDDFQRVKQAITLYLKAMDATGTSSERQVALLLTVGGPSLLDVLKLQRINTSAATPTIGLQSRGGAFGCTVLYSCYIFHTLIQLMDDFDTLPIASDEHLTHRQLKTRGYGFERDKMICNQIIWGQMARELELTF